MADSSSHSNSPQAAAQRSGLTITSADGLQLEGQIGQPATTAAAAVIAHPHPLHGGSMTNPVVECMFRSFIEADVTTVRFNFRGVGQSEGNHDDGIGEREDLLAAIDTVRETQLGGARHSGPLIVAGYSFGADIALSCDHSAISGWLAVAPPLGALLPEKMEAKDSNHPKLIIAGTSDEFRPADQVAAETARWSNTTVDQVVDANHFFSRPTDLQSLVRAVESFVASIVSDE